MLDSGQEIQAPLVISNIDPRVTFDQLLSNGEAPARYRAKLRRLELSPSAVAAYLTTDLDVRALGIPHENILFDSWDYRAGYDTLAAGGVPTTFVTIPTLTDPALAPPGEHVVIVMAPAPPTGSNAELAERVLARAEHVVPGLRDHVTSMVDGAPGTRQLALHRISSIYGFALTPQQAGPRRLAQHTPIAGLHLVGQWARPGHGVPWVVESGVQLAERILGRAPAARGLPHRLVPAATPT